LHILHGIDFLISFSDSFFFLPQSKVLLNSKTQKQKLMRLSICLWLDLLLVSHLSCRAWGVCHWPPLNRPWDGSCTWQELSHSAGLHGRASTWTCS
jgi:hypothetical protein